MSTNTDDLRKLVAEQPPVSIKLQVGDLFLGRFSHLEKAESAYGPCWVAIFDQHDCSGMAQPPEIPEGGRASLWLLHTALLSQMKKAKPAKGEWAAVRRLPDTTSGAGRGYADYTVKTTRDLTAPPSWDQVEPSSNQFADEPAF